MRWRALATDYDGTLAHDGVVHQGTLDALARFRASGRTLLLVTGRELASLQATFARLDLFDRVVAENGALLVDPKTGAETPLTDPPSAAFVAALHARGVTPLSVGRTIVATRVPHDATVLDVIRTMGLELQVIFNKGAVMILPSGVNKATGLAATLAELGMNAADVVGIGDAENDHSFIQACGLRVAVANALPSLAAEVDWVTTGARGDGVSEVLDAIVADDAREHPPKRP